jgi:hypothetical protein
VPASYIAFVYARLGERDRAFHWLEKSVEQRDVYVQFLKVDPRWDSLRDDPGFQALLRRMNFPEN